MTTKHTPGPWKASDPRDASWTFPRDVWSEHYKIASVHLMATGKPQKVADIANANAALIAAAPDLLAACEILVKAMDTASDDVERAIFVMEKAIAKAKGEP